MEPWLCWVEGGWPELPFGGSRLGGFSREIWLVFHWKPIMIFHVVYVFFSFSRIFWKMRFQPNPLESLFRTRSPSSKWKWMLFAAVSATPPSKLITDDKLNFKYRISNSELTFMACWKLEIFFLQFFIVVTFDRCTCCCPCWRQFDLEKCSIRFIIDDPIWC